jgi:hypothetical protein
MKMKTIGNHKWMILGAVLLALVLAVPMVGSAVAAPVNTKVNIPPEVVNVDSSGAEVYFRKGTTDYGPFENGDLASLEPGTYSWKLRINNYTSPLRTGFIVDGTNELTVTAADYCKMKVLVDSKMKNLDNSSGYITFYGVSGQFDNNDELYFPMGANLSWYVNVNGKTSGAHYKTVDCTPLDSGEYPVVYGSYCKMQIIVPAELQTLGATVRIYGISQTFTGGETVVLPMGQTITWYLKINGKEVPHTGKPVDCTPINVTAADYCTVVNNTGQTINIYKGITLAPGASVVLPMGANIEWKYNAGPSTPNRWPGIKKTVDCTPIGP